MIPHFTKRIMVGGINSVNLLVSCAFVLLRLRLYVPVNNFSVMLRRFLSRNEDEVSCSRTQHFCYADRHF